MTAAASVRIGADIGGTFTDVMVLDADGSVHPFKVLSTPEDFGRAVIAAVRMFLEQTGLPPAGVSEIDHGTTVATNAILEKKGAKVGLLTTLGFRDVLEIRRVRLPVLYDLMWQKPEPIVRRERRLEVTERLGPGGEVRVALDLDSARAAIARLKESGVEALAVCFLHSYANASHERAVGELAAREFPFVSLSCDVLPEIREYERTASTVIDAYVKPVVAGYLRNLRSHLDPLEVRAPLLVMQSSGGLVSDAGAADRPVRIIESGPAAGVIAAAAAGRAAGFANLITFDMGGTTAKASIVEHGEIHLSPEYEVGSELSQPSRLIKGGGHLIRIPAIDIAEVGAGGGSIVWIDRGGAMRVGPESAGAAPGPACYALGGERPTVTDANVLLGYLNPGHLVGGGLKLDRSRAERAVDDAIAKPLGLTPVQAAEGIHRIANATMQRAIRSVSIERGRDPRDFALIAFGGSGPVHAAGLAQDLDIARILVPPYPGLFSSLGLLAAPVEQIYTRSVLVEASKLDPQRAEAMLREMELRARADLAAEGFGAASLELARFVELHYRKQISELMLPLPDRALAAADLVALGEVFHREHEQTYGYAIRDERVEVVAFKVRARGRRANGVQVPWDRLASGPATQAPQENKRAVWFGVARGWVSTPLIGRADLGTAPAAGPFVVEEYDSTVVVPPDWTARRMDFGFIVLERKP
jgi:N-methylhydantoinase A